AGQQTSQAHAICKQVLTQHPEHPDATHLLGVITHEQGYPQVARETLERVIAIQPDNASLWRNYGDVLWSLAQLPQALNAYERALALDPHNAGAHIAAAQCHLRLLHSDEAAPHIAEALKLDPQATEAHVCKGWMLHQHARVDEAVAVLRSVLFRKPNVPRFRVRLGISLLLAGQC